MNKLHIILLSFLVFGLLSYKLTQPFWGHHEFNGVFYGMIAKNYLRYGLLQTRGGQITNAPQASPQEWSLHKNHPATYPLILSLFFKVFAAHEYVARLVSILASIVGIALLGKLLTTIYNKTPYSFLAVVPILFTPLFLYYGSMPVFEPLLFPIVSFGLLKFWETRKTGQMKWVVCAAFAASLIDWPGFWLPVWLIVYELITRKRKRVIALLLVSVVSALGLILIHQLITTGRFFEDLIAVGRFRLEVSEQPYTLVGWFRLLLSRSRAFWGLPIIFSSALGLAFIFRRKRREIFRFLLITLGLGVSHILVFRNITWYHDYMLYHTLPFVGLALGSFFNWIFSKTRSALLIQLLVLLISVTTALSTRQFFKALANLAPHKDCVEMGYQVKRSQETQTFRLNSEKAKECPAFIGFYGEKQFEIVKY